MKTIKYIALVLVTVMATSCGKDNSRILIFAEDMHGNGAKIWLDPDPSQTSSSASWVPGERINLNGSNYSIIEKSSSHYLDVGDAEVAENLYAIYPASIGTNGNAVSVTNNRASASTVVIRELAVNFRNGGHDIIFPMAATGTRSDGKLYFNHLTGGLRLTLTDTSSAKDYTVGSVRVVVYGDEAAPTPITIHNVTTRWAVEGPVLPNGEIGEIAGNVPVGYASQMNFSLKNNGLTGKDIPQNGSISFCVPVTVTPVKELVITGYDTNGAQLFTREKELAPAIAIQANYMYNIPEIKF